MSFQLLRSRASVACRSTKQQQSRLVQLMGPTHRGVISYVLSQQTQEILFPTPLRYLSFFFFLEKRGIYLFVVNHSFQLTLEVFQCYKFQKKKKKTIPSKISLSSPPFYFLNISYKIFNGMKLPINVGIKATIKFSFIEFPTKLQIC